MFRLLTVVAMGITLLFPHDRASAQQPSVPDKVSALSKALRAAKDDQARREAAGALANLGDPGLLGLLKALQDVDQEVRYAAAYAIAQMGRKAKSAAPDLINAMKDDSPFVRAQSAAALGAIGLPEIKTAIPALIKLLDKDQCHEAAYALGNAGTEAKEAVPVLIKCLKKAEPSCRADAARALGCIGVAAKEATPHLVKALSDEDRLVRFNAGVALAGIGPAAIDAKPALSAKMQDKDDKESAIIAAYALKTIEPDNKVSIPFLIKMLKEDNLFHRAAAVAALGELGSAAKDAIPSLAELLKDPCDPVRADVEAALKKIGAKP